MVIIKKYYCNEERRSRHIYRFLKKIIQSEKGYSTVKNTLLVPEEVGAFLLLKFNQSGGLLP